MKKHVHVWHLETLQRPRRDAALSRTYSLAQITLPLPELARFLYVTVGAPWCWYMRLGWRYGDWLRRMQDERVQFWVAYAHGAPVGYFELELQARQSVEICYFGLIPEFIGRGQGKAMLEDAMTRAWELGGRRVWLHTCTLDHPSALSNYIARGLVVFREEDIFDDIPDEPIQPWAGAAKA